MFGTWIVYFVSRNFLLYDFFVIFAENGVKMYKNRYNELYGKDVGIDQQQYKIIEEMTQRINDVDWSFIQMIEEGKNN